MSYGTEINGVISQLSYLHQPEDELIGFHEVAMTGLSPKEKSRWQLELFVRDDINKVR